MNERIKELEKQAYDYYWSLDDGVRNTDAFIEKFAKLIVQECRPWLSDDAFEEVKEHFGVEE